MKRPKISEGWYRRFTEEEIEALFAPTPLEQEVQYLRKDNEQLYAELRKLSKTIAKLRRTNLLLRYEAKRLKLHLIRLDEFEALKKIQEAVDAFPFQGGDDGDS
jgi:regulator of replication initiation timing